MVNAQVEKLIEDERRNLEQQQIKKQQYYETMKEQYAAKEQIRARVEEADRRELEKIAQYQATLDRRDRQQKLEAERKEKEKEVIYLKLKAAEEQRRKEQEELEAIRIEYYQFMEEEAH